MGRVGAGSPYCTHTRTGANGKVTGRGAPTRPNVAGWQWPKGAGVSPQLCGLCQSRVAAIASWTLAEGSIAAVHPVLVFALQTTQHVDDLKVIHALSSGLPQDHLVVLVHVTQVGRCRCHVRSFHPAAGLGDLLERRVARQGYPLVSRDPHQGGCPRYDEQSLWTGPHQNSAHLQIDVLRSPNRQALAASSRGRAVSASKTVFPRDRPHTFSRIAANFREKLGSTPWMDRMSCGAKTRLGTPCRRHPAPGRTRCRLHGGAPGSGAPEGEANGNFRHGRYSRVKRAERIAKANASWRRATDGPET